MGMTIDEARTALGKERKYALHENKQAFDIAIDTMKKYQMMELDYKARLRADMLAMLTEIQLEIEETAKDAHTNAFMNGYKDMYLNGISASAIKCSEIIQQKIDKLKEVKDGENNN